MQPAYQQINIFQPIVNLKQVSQLKQAISLIVGSHQCMGTDHTSCIRRGEEILYQLRASHHYGLLLAHFLMDGLQNNYPNGGFTKNNNYSKMFVILELSKLPVLNDETIWWHLLQFYYCCNQKLQSIIIDIVLKHCVIIPSNYPYIYQPFLNYPVTNYKQNGRTSLSHLNKALKLSHNLIQKLSELTFSSLYFMDWKIDNINKIMGILQELLKMACMQLQYNNYVQWIIALLLRLKMIHDQLCSSEMPLERVNLILCQFPVPQISKTLLYLTSNNRRDPHKEEQQWCISSLEILLKQTSRKNRIANLQFILFVYYLKKNNIIGIVKDSILDVYYRHIVDVQIRSPQQYVLFDSQCIQQDDMHRLGNPDHLSYYSRYILLEQCLANKQIPQSAQCIVLLSCTVHKTGNPALLPILKSAIEHKNNYSDAVTFSCLRYLHRFVLADPNHDLIGISALLLDFRTVYPNYGPILDFMLCKAMHHVVYSGDCQSLWMLVKVWVNNLYLNYMDVNALSFYPILTILQHIDQYYFIEEYVSSSQINISSEYSIKFQQFFNQLVDLLMQQCKNTKTNRKNIRCIDQDKYKWCDNMEIFYKLSEIMAKYLMCVHRYNIKMKQIKHQAVMEQQKITKNIYFPKQIMTQVLDKSQMHIFKNQLYSRDTAYIYICSLLNKNDVQGNFDFLTNLMTATFWRGLQQNQIIFFSCVFMGLINQIYKDDQKSVESMLFNLHQILNEIYISQTLPEQSITKINQQLQQFLTNFNPQFQLQLQAQSQFAYKNSYLNKFDTGCKIAIRVPDENQMDFCNINDNNNNNKLK